MKSFVYCILEAEPIGTFSTLRIAIHTLLTFPKNCSIRIENTEVLKNLEVVETELQAGLPWRPESKVNLDDASKAT